MNKTILLAIAIMLAVAFISCGDHSFLDETPSNNFLEETSSPGDDGGQQSAAEVVGPLLQTAWGEENQYNDFSAAIAMAQIMKFHTEQNGSEATLISKARAAINSSSNKVELGDIRAALINSFGYNKDIRILARFLDGDEPIYVQSLERFEAAIKEQLDAGLPVIIRGKYFGDNWHDYRNYWDSTRIYIVDGYDDIGRFHINLGHGGKSNAWVFLNNMYAFGSSLQMLINVKPDTGEPTGYAPGLVNFTVTKPTAYQPAVYQNESFQAKFRIYNAGSEAFPLDSAGAALVNNNGNVEAFVCRSWSKELNVSTYNDATYQHSQSCRVPSTTRPGKYRLMIFFKLKGKDWELAEFTQNVNDVPNSIDFTVAAGEAPDIGYGFWFEDFSSTKTSALKDEQFNVIVKLVNVTIEIIPGGQLRAVLFDMNGNMVTDIATKGIERVASGASENLTLNCYIPASVAPGQYSLRIDFKPANQTERKIISFSLPNVPNSINFEVLQ